LIKKILLLTFVYVNIILADGLDSSYYNIKDTSKKKETFFKFINNIAIIANNNILDDREYIKNNFNLNTNRMINIRQRYRIQNNASLKDYLYKVDIIPISMIMAQAALETAWGKSRFFKQAKNIFGQWTWKGKGLVPKFRKKGSTHKVKIFSSYQNSLRAYLLNLNRGWAYKKLRKLRSIQRSKNQKLTGTYLAKGLDKYSAKKEAYVGIVKSIINHNNLSIYDIY